MNEWHRQIFSGRCSPSATPTAAFHGALRTRFTLEIQKISRRMHNSCCIFLWVATSESESSRPATPDINFVLFHPQLGTAAYKYYTMFMKS